MSWDIYGNPLQRGHCEVHPHVHEEYPCSVCLSERRQHDEANRDHQAQHDMILEVEHLKMQRDELLETLEAAVKQMEDDLLFIDSECGSGRSLADLESEGELPPALLKSRELISKIKGGAL